MPCYRTNDLVVYYTYPKGCTTSQPSPYTLPLSSDDLIYTGPNLPYTGIQTDDELTEALQRIDAKIGEFGLPDTAVHTVAETLGGVVFTMSSPASNDDPTVRFYQNRVVTDDATPTTLHTVTIPANTIVVLESRIVARRTGGTAGTADDGAYYRRVGTYQNIGGVATIIDSIELNPTVESQASWNATYTPSGADVLIQVTGALDNIVTWHLAELRVTMVST